MQTPSERIVGKQEVIPPSWQHSDCRSAFGLNAFDQIIPTIPLGHFKVSQRRNPVGPALGEHFDSALIHPVEDAKLVGTAGVVGGVLAAEFEVREEGCEAVLTLNSSPQWTTGTGAVLALVLSPRNRQASHRRSGHWIICQADSRLRFCGRCSLA